MTHPVLAERWRLVFYLALWLPAGAMLAGLLVFTSDLSVWPSFAFALPVALFYAFICLGAWYPSHSTPLASGASGLAAKHLIAAGLSSALGQLVGGVWAALLGRLPVFASMPDVFRQQVPLLFAIGMLLYLLAVAASYLVIAAETGRQAEMRALEAEKVQALAARDLELARAIQQRLLPPTERQGDDWSLAARNLAAQLVAGDFYDYFHLPDGRLVLAVADVSGKGIGASLVTATVKAVLPLLASDGSMVDTLGRLNERLVDELTRRTFVALSLACFDPATGEIELVNAGLPDAYLLRTDGTVRTLEVPQPRLPLGLKRGLAYTAVSTRLEVGERLLMITDGLPEAPMQNGEPIGYDQLAILLETPNGAPVPWLEGLFARLREATAPELADDWTAVVLERGGRSVSP